MQKKPFMLLSFLSLCMLPIVLPLAIDSLALSASAAEFPTPAFGGNGGNRSYNLDCGQDAVMVGLIAKSGSWLDAIGVICRKVNPQNGNLGEEFTRGPKGGSGGTARITKCPFGAVINSAKVQSGQFVNLFATQCYVWEPASKKPTRKYRDRRNREVFPRVGEPCFGIGCSYSDQFVCPTGKAGKALRGRYGAFIDNLRFVCDDWDK
jgi:hypothetical protein